MASSPKIALVAARRYLPPLILLDVDMPVERAARAVRALRGEQGLHDAFVISMMAVPSGRAIDWPQVAGCDGQLPKPIDVARLLALFPRHLVASAPELLLVDKDA